MSLPVFSTESRLVFVMDCADMLNYTHFLDHHAEATADRLQINTDTQSAPQCSRPPDLAAVKR